MLRLEGMELAQGDFRLRADWQVAPGEKVALIGPSGAGKSSLLSAIAGFFPPVGGRVLWNGQDIGQLPPGDRPLTILFQDQNLFPHLTLAQNVAMGLRPDLRLTREQTQRVDQVLERVGLQGLGPRKPAQLSGGQIGRAALARALLRSRPLLLLDEPFAALGPALKADMLDLVAEVTAETGATLLMVTHDPADARRIADLTVLVAEGTARPPRPTMALLDNPPPELRAYLGQ
jgi:thiamine transport system ATP-binding protein